MNPGTQLADEAARLTIRNDTRATLFVEAGAGSGKTSVLVSRTQTLALEDDIPIANIAAVTFTERAAAELRDRLRARLEQAALHTTRAEQRERALAALDDLDTAAIGTLHSFAQRILSEHPIEAGIPPLIEVLDEVGSSVAFEGRWSQLRTELLDDPEMSSTLEMALATGISLDHVRSLITKLNSDWDLVHERVVAPGRPAEPTLPDLSGLVAKARRLSAMESCCTDQEDKFLPRLQALGTWADDLDSVRGDPVDQLEGLRSLAGLKWGNGQKGNWGDHEAKQDRLGHLRAQCQELQQCAADLVRGVVEATLRSIVHWCGTRVLESAQRRRADGRLEFQDLLVLARNLLRDNAEVRATLQRRYQRLLLDEFQDTDPIQIEIAVRIAGGADATQADWEDVHVPQGSLFVVGDPKQSIYRFRRADIAMYLRAQHMLGGEVSLTTNFRTVEPILDWVNAVFSRIIVPDPEKQPQYQPLAAFRGEPTVGAPVTVLGADPQPDGLRASELRELEAGDVARSIVQALDQGWTTEEKAPTSGTEATTTQRTWRPLRPGDITILIPARTSLPFLETALDAAGVMYRTESSSLVYHAQEVRDLFAAVRALADPSDAFALVTTLRSPLFGCGDDDLWTWKRARGSFNLLAPAPRGQQDHPVAVAIAALRDLYRRSHWLTPSEVLGALAVERRMFEVAAFGPRARDSWRRLRFVIDQARAWSEVEHGGLRSYLAWATAQSAEGSRVAESVLPESDVDSVRIMTIHAAKGLEFPMVILSGMTAQPVHSKGVRLLWSRDGYAVSLSKDLETGDFQDQLPPDEQMSSYERLRLMYVAATRARDHLVVSLHRSGIKDTNARRLADVDAATAAGAVPLPTGAAGSAPAQPAPVPAAPPDFNAWLAGVRRSAEASRHHPAFSASGLEGTDPDAEGPLPDVEGPLPDISVAADFAITATRTDDDVASGVAKGGRDVELPAWSKGRYGSAIGRAVHGVLQVVDLAVGHGLEDAVAAQCVAEGVVEFAPLVTSLVRSALGSDVVKRAAVREHWRESYVGMVQQDGTVLEGFVDLIYREDDGSLVIVDYKTDDAPDDALPSRVGYYAPQLNAYRTIVETVIDGSSATPILLFARESAARSLKVTNQGPKPG
ncbi:MAG: UvrD-helicase domain-containing protein [Actinobacteria bacterium]|nr:UvrD-helicase domain-containing protein [Actinomycetota bacterium]